MGNFGCGVFLVFTGCCRVLGWPVLSQTVMPEPFIRKMIRAHSWLVAGGSSCFLPSMAQCAAGSGSLHTQRPALGLFLNILSLKSLLTLKITKSDCSSEGLGVFFFCSEVVGSDRWSASTLWLWLWWLGSSLQSQVAQGSCVEAELTWAGSSQWHCPCCAWGWLPPTQSPVRSQVQLQSLGLGGLIPAPTCQGYPSFLFNSRGLATQTHLGQTWAHLTIFIPNLSVLNLGRIQQIFPSVAVGAVRNRAFQPLRVFAHIAFLNEGGAFSLKRCLFQLT